MSSTARPGSAQLVAGRLEEFESFLRRRLGRVAQRRERGGHEPDRFGAGCHPRLVGDREVAVVHRVEGATEDEDRAHESPSSL